MQGKWIKPVLAVIAVPVVTIGAYQMVRAYEAGTAFQPNGSGRELQANQVIFSGEEDTSAQKNGEEQNGESELWEKDKTAEDSLSPELKNSANYLFQNGRRNLPDNGNGETINLAGEEAGNNSFLPEDGNRQPDTGNNYVYDMVQDPAKADEVIATGQGGSSTDIPGTGQGDSATIPTIPTIRPTPSTSDSTAEPAPTSTPAPSTSPQPTVRPSDTIKDPTPSKPEIGANNGTGYGFEDHPYVEKPVGTAGEVKIAASLDPPCEFYKGQIVDAHDIFCILDGGVWIYNSASSSIVARRYLWGEEDLGRYIRIDRLSFDGGNTWVGAEEFPVRIPMETENMLIDVFYRLKADGEWIKYQNDVITYHVKNSRFYVLSRKLNENDTEIPEDCILNGAFERYLEPGTYFNLYGMQEKYLQATQDNTWAMSQLFSGWTENGEPADWFYEVTPGRHILEPGDLLPVPDGCAVRLKNYRMNGEICPLQVLYTWTDDVLSDTGELEVPEGVQVVEPDGYVDIPTVEEMTIPASVLWVDANTLIVKKGYRVSEDNEVYTATKNGWLLDKTGTELLAVPYDLETITIPETIQKMDIAAFHRLQRIEISAKDRENIPEIVPDNLFDCQIIVPDDLVNDFYEVNPIEYDDYRGVTIVSDQGVGYALENGKVVSTNGELRCIQQNGSNSVYLTDEIKSIHEGALRRSADGTESVKMLILSESGRQVILEDGCFENSDITSIQCYTSEQAASVKRQLQEQRVTGISVQTVAQSKEGFRYTVKEDNGEKTILLLKAPEEITIFDGSVTAEDGSAVVITGIGDNAFSTCSQLEWVILPESVSSIGYEAFRGCGELQGILIDTKDTITIGNRSMEDCPKLRFVASNAMHAERVGDYDPEITDADAPVGSRPHYFYRLDNSVGYGGNSVGFINGEDEADCIRRYTLVDLDETGRSKVLYAANDVSGNWLAIRSGTEVPEQVKLPVNTREIYEYAMAGTTSETGDGTYILNWSELTGLQFIDACAFAGSGLSGEISFAEDSVYILGEQAFYGCTGITAVDLPGEAAGLEQAVFSGCSNLKTASFGPLWNGVAIYAGIFDGCDSLTDISFADGSARLTFDNFSRGFGFYFDSINHDRGLSVHVPGDTVESYIRNWRYMFAGYVKTPSQTAYLVMWQDIQFENIDWENWKMPADEVVDRIMRERLLAVENRLRGMLGAEEVTEPIDYYPYHVDENNYVTLVGTPSDAEYIWVDKYTLELFDDWKFSYIGTDAFSNSKKLQKVIFGDSIEGIYSNAFRGVESDSLTLVFEGCTPPELLGGTEDAPFTFGVDMSKVTISVPPGQEEAYYEAWKDYGVTIDGYTPPETEADISGGNVGIATNAGIMEDAMTVSGSDTVSSVSDGDALPQSKKSDIPEDKDSTQEETVQ